MKEMKLYYKDEKGKLKEYKDPEPPYDNALYRKVRRGNKTSYEAVSMLQTRDLGEGVWVVTKHTYGRSITSGKYLRDMFMCEKASDIQEVSLAKLGGMDKFADYLCSHINEIPRGLSTNDYCRAIVGILFKYEEEKKK